MIGRTEPDLDWLGGEGGEGVERRSTTIAGRGLSRCVEQQVLSAYQQQLSMFFPT